MGVCQHSSVFNDGLEVKQQREGGGGGESFPAFPGFWWCQVPLVLLSRWLDCSQHKLHLPLAFSIHLRTETAGLRFTQIRHAPGLTERQRKRPYFQIRPVPRLRTGSCHLQRPSSIHKADSGLGLRLAAVQAAVILKHWWWEGSP